MSNDPGAGGTPPPATNSDPAGGEPKTFTQAEVDQIIADRLKRAKAAAPPDYEDLKKAKVELDQLKAAQLTDLERAQKAAQDADARAQALADKARDALLRAAVVSAAQKAGAVDPDAVLALIDRSNVTVGDDDRVTGAEEAVKALLDAKTYLVGKPPTPAPGGADGGVRGTPPGGLITQEQLATMSTAEIDAAYRAGKLNHLVKAS